MYVYILENIQLLILYSVIIFPIFYFFFKRSTASILEHSMFYCISLTLQLSLFYCISFYNNIDFCFVLYISIFYFIFVLSNLFINKKHVLPTLIKNTSCVKGIYVLVFIQFILVLLFFHRYGFVGLTVSKLASSGISKLNFFQEDMLGKVLDSFLREMANFNCLAIFLFFFSAKKSGVHSYKTLLLLIPSFLFFLGSWSKAPLLYVLYAAGLAIKKTNTTESKALSISLFLLFFSTYFFYTLLYGASSNFLPNLIGRAWGEGDLYYYLFEISNDQLDKLTVGNIFGNSISYRIARVLGYFNPSFSIGEQLVYNIYGASHFGPNSLAPIWGYVAGGYLGGLLYAVYLALWHIVVARFFLKSKSFIKTLFWGFLYLNIFTLFRDQSLFWGGPWVFIWPLTLLFFVTTCIFNSFNKFSSYCRPEKNTFVPRPGQPSTEYNAPKK